MGLRWESMRLEDAAAWAELLARAEAVDRTGENYDAGDLAEELEDPLLDLDRGTRAAWDGDTMVAVGLLRCGPSADPVHRLLFDGTVDPAHRRRGLGRDLTRWALATAPALSRSRFPASPAELHVEVAEGNPGKAALFEGEGFDPQRWFFVMGRALGGDLPQPAPPAGVRVAGFDSAYDAATRDARNEAFAGNWGSTAQTEESWKGYTGTRSFRPDLSFLALAEPAGPAADPEVVAMLMTHYFAADTAATGLREAWLGTIGTRPAWRRRGVAGALIAAMLAEARRQGFDRAALGVDAGSPTGALSVYRAAGFEVEHRRTRYVRKI